MSAIDLSRMTAPTVIQQVDYETELQAIKDDLIAKDPALADVLALESEPLTKLVEVFAYRLTTKLAEFNDRAKGLLLAYATSSDLDHIGVTYYNTPRLTIQEANPAAVPPLPEIKESDDAYRDRLLIALDGYSTAGPEAAYIYHAKSVSGTIKNVTATSPSPGQVVVTVLTSVGNGVPDQVLLDQVDTTLGDDVRPMTDQVTVQAPTVIEYTVDATLTVYAGFNQGNIQTEAQSSLDTWVQSQNLLGRDITVAGLKAAMLVDGVHDVVLNDTGNGTDLVANLIVADTEVAYCLGVTVAVGGIGG